MAAPKGNNYAKGNNGGNPGYGALNMIRNNVKKHCPLWWESWEKLMKSKEMKEKQYAMTEFNKLQAKLMPTIVGGDDDKPLIVQFNEPFNLTSKAKGDNRK